MPTLRFDANRKCAIVKLLELRSPVYLRAEKPLMIAAWLISAVLLLRFAVDFTVAGPILAVPFWGLVAVSLLVMGVNAFSSSQTQDRDKNKASERGMRAVLLLFIPLGFFASSLDCTGLSLHGCSAFCTFIKLFWIPLLALVCLAYYVSGHWRWPAVLSVMSFVTLFPHCICYNLANAWWIDRIGASPECYMWGFVVSTLAVSALAARQRYLVTLLISALIIVGSLAFFIAHHYFRFPW